MMVGMECHHGNRDGVGGQGQLPTSPQPCSLEVATAQGGGVTALPSLPPYLPPPHPCRHGGTLSLPLFLIGNLLV